MYIILLLFAFLTNPSCAYPSTADGIMVHDMEMINQQRFRIEEINDYNDVKTEKERYQKRNAPSEPLVNKLFNKKQFVKEDGKIKIESQN